MAAVADRVKELVVRTLHRYNMLRFGRRLGVAVSGGADSVCMLHLLAELAPELGLALTVLHVNHGLRGAESEGDQRFVENLAATLGMRCTLARLDEAALRRGNLEQSARRERLRLFSEWRSSLALDAVAVGHTRSDQAETVLMRLVRGTALPGLAGIQAVTADRRIRPLIETGRQEVRDWLERRGLGWREDSSNGFDRLLRNRVRQTVLPVLRLENPRIEEALSRLARIAQQEEEAWQGIVEPIMARVSRPDGDALILDSAELARMGQALARRVLRQAVERVRGGLEGLDQVHFEALERLIRDRDAGAVSLPGVRAERCFSEIRIAAPPAETKGLDLELGGPGVYGKGWLSTEVELRRVQSTGEEGFQAFSHGSRYNGGRHFLDGDLAGFPLRLRAWKPGDRYQPHGARREYLLHELFQRRRIPRWERDTWPVIVSGQRIAWARRFGVADWAAAAPGHPNAIEVRDVSTGEPKEEE